MPIDQPVFADIGIAVILQTTVHRGASIVGTCNYMAPEAFEVEGIGKHTGVWALACVIVEMSTGQRPWADMPMQQIMMADHREHKTVRICKIVVVRLLALLFLLLLAATGGAVGWRRHGRAPSAGLRCACAPARGTASRWPTGSTSPLVRLRFTVVHTHTHTHTHTCIFIFIHIYNCEPIYIYIHICICIFSRLSR
jgi:serine/threonine protein kinase